MATIISNIILLVSVFWACVIGQKVSNRDFFCIGVYLNSLSN